MAENYLSTYERNCIQKSFCEVAVTARVIGTDEFSKAAEASVK